ncbi:hypothetical protein PBI_TOURACH_142 [Mycobacterium phage Tourach]|uniref:Uncharacterized protein n=1 Tax=Mycobacterium phage Tourach TaxID=2599882 RepID=A0A5J6TWG2_9CAUD|nr:hypothetical protein J4T98_gp108 [Mycobacterium phage Tourach]QFG14364.1 hypothetical protein PBI_TOURACH_142 [Mycobacterium phage Tourach]
MDTQQINVTTERAMTQRGVLALALLITVGAALAALVLHWPTGDTASAPVLRCTVTNVDGHVFLDDCDTYSDDETETLR